MSEDSEFESSRRPSNDNITIRASDIILKPFIPNGEETAPKPTDDLSRIMRHNALASYLSTPLFVIALTDISLALIHIADRKAYLKTELTKLNRCLPGAVYIPFVNSSMRNYAVLHIAVEEAKVFQTKERAPLLLCFEVFRPDELYLSRERKSINNYLQSSDDLYDHQRSNSMHSSNYKTANPGKKEDFAMKKQSRAAEMNKASDIKASNPLIISEIKRVSLVLITSFLED